MGLKRTVYLSEEMYDTLVTDGTLTVGETTIEYSDDDLYLVPEEKYPVGAIYISATEISPAEKFGGTWTRIEDRFLLAAGRSYQAGSTGGEATHTLTIDEMPTHNHGFQQYYHAGTDYNYAPIHLDYVPLSYVATTQEGGSKPHNNMPPYLTVYMWQRVS